MRIITCNLNGIRSAAKKGFFDWMLQQVPQVVCVQETKAQLGKLEGEVYRPADFFSYFNDAEKPGYSGVGIYCREEPLKVSKGTDWCTLDCEGRYLQIDYKDLSIISVYMPSGSSGEIRQSVKFEFMQQFLEHLKQLRRQQRNYIICGDWNIAHRTIDIKNWRANQKNSGFLPEEREWMQRLLTEHEWVDAFRVLNQQAEQYTWWSNRGQAYAKNVGWRIDYQIVTPPLKNKIVAAEIYKAQRFSDHAPLIIDYLDK